MKTCALVGAADFNAQHFQQLDAEGVFDFVIAVDGGFAHLEAIGRKPSMALGDFDSLGYVPTGMRISKFPVNKSKSDMELALERALNLHYERVFVYGALSGRLDHTLGALELFAAFSERGLLVNGITDTQAVTFVTGPDIFEMPAIESGTISVFSMSDNARGVFERGLKWELDDVVLTNRTTWGLSNEFQGEPVMIGVEEGTIAVFFPLD